MSERKYFGYDYRGRQPGIQVRISARKVDQDAIENIDDWLNNVLKIAPEYFVASTNRPKRPEQLYHAFFERVLIVYGELLRIAGFPAFDGGSVISLKTDESDDEQVEAIIRIFVIDNVLEKTFISIIREALKLAQRMCDCKISNESIANLYDGIIKAFRIGEGGVAPFAKTVIPICRIAADANIPFRHLGDGFFQFGWGARGRVFHNSAAQGDSVVGATLSKDKQITGSLLRAAGFPVPDHVSVSSASAAKEAAAKLGWPVVVKPADRERSSGVTVDVVDDAGLVEAFKVAQSESSRVLVERQVPGVCHRILVAGGSIVYAVRRNPASVVGNGIDTVRDLVSKANEELSADPPWKRLRERKLDNLAIECLAKVGLSPSSIPESGVPAPLRPFTSPEWGGNSADVLADIHPDNERLAIDVASACSLAIVGIDLISTDISQSWQDNDAAINEVNFRPEFATSVRQLRNDGLLSVLADGDGRVPVHLVMSDAGEDLHDVASEIAAGLRSDGISCYVTGSDYSEDGDGRPLSLSQTSAFDRAIALLFRKDLEALVIVDNRGEFLTRGFPVDRFENVCLVHRDRKAREHVALELTKRISARNVRQRRQ